MLINSFSKFKILMWTHVCSQMNTKIWKKISKNSDLCLNLILQQKLTSHWRFHMKIFSSRLFHIKGMQNIKNLFRRSIQSIMFKLMTAEMGLSQILVNITLPKYIKKIQIFYQCQTGRFLTKTMRKWRAESSTPTSLK